jgi:hypothetical protein
MDPNHTLASLRQALIDEDHEAYTEALEALLEWERSGGFMPDWPEPDAVQPDRRQIAAMALPVGRNCSPCRE